MSTGSFEERLAQTLDFTEVSSGYLQSYDALKRIAEAIQSRMNEVENEDEIANPIRLEIEPGFLATMGQQLKIVLKIPGKNFRDTLFRAYVPENGWPIILDLGGEDPIECLNKAELENNILDFIEKIRDRMASYREYASS